MDSNTPADGPVPGSWDACKEALVATSTPAVHSGVQQLPFGLSAPWPAVLALGDDALFDRVPGVVDDTHVIMITTGPSRVLTTLRVTPEAACALVSALMPAATSSRTFVDAILEGIDLAGDAS